eukprot:m.344234 g.344234  ORF g.344234 m.344234 type:complete len:305 (+) comp24035_c0_seq1:255-1169(+)
MKQAFRFLYFAILLTQTSSLLSRDEAIREYFKMALEYFESNSTTAECLRYQQEHGFEFKQPAKVYLVGVEGCGHHYLMSLGGNTVTSNSLGGSFPNGVRWRMKKNTTESIKQAVRSCPNVKNKEIDIKSHFNMETNFIVLVRDVAASKISALRRFWSNFGETGLENELRGYYASMQQMQKNVETLKCKNTLFIPYELLIAYPQVILSVLTMVIPIQNTEIEKRSTFEKMASYTPVYMDCRRYHDKSLLASMNKFIKNHGPVYGCIESKCAADRLVEEIHSDVAGFRHLVSSVIPRKGVVECKST